MIEDLDISESSRTWLKAQGVHSDALLGQLCPADVRDLPLGDLLVLRATFPNLRPATTAQPTLAEAIATLAAGDLGLEAQKMAASVGLSAVVITESGKVSEVGTAAYFAHLEAGGLPASSGLWRDLRVVSVPELCQGAKVRASPITGKPLQDGHDEDTGVGWGRLDVVGAALVAWSIEQGLLRGVADQETLDDFLCFGPLRTRCHRRASASGEMSTGFQRWIDLVTTAAKWPPERPQFKQGSSPVASLHSLILACFGEHDIRLLARDMGVAASMPGATASISSLAHGLIGCLDRRGLVGADFFGRILAKRPQRAVEIVKVAQSYGVNL